MKYLSYQNKLEINYIDVSSPEGNTEVAGYICGDEKRKHFNHTFCANIQLKTICLPVLTSEIKKNKSVIITFFCYYYLNLQSRSIKNLILSLNKLSFIVVRSGENSKF